MKNWTTQAEQRLAEYLRERAVREGFEGEDAVELKEDLRRHIHEEAEQSSAETIGLMNLEQLLGRLDAGYRPLPQSVAIALQRGRLGGFFQTTFGVILPTLVLILEVFTSFCGSVFFSPIPTWWHVAWIATVPLVNGWLIWGGRSARSGALGLATGFVAITTIFYALLFLPLAPLSLLALIFYGLGFISLTPILAAFSTWRIGRIACQNSDQPSRFRVGWRIGAAVSACLIIALEVPAVWTRVNLTSAMRDGKESLAAIDRLRFLHSENTLLKACYEGNRGVAMSTDISGWILSGWNVTTGIFDDGNSVRFDSEKARDVFFRVTGKPFNTLRPPDGSRGNSWLGGGDMLGDIEFDDHLGGDQVAVRLKNLDLSDSRFDGHIDSPSQLGYGEWTMVFKNRSGEAKEARCQIKLPHDGRVSRLTLWVNGEPREAAFSTVSKVKAAYKSVAVVQRRDPVLVNMVGPDTVMLQCFPVPAKGEMKVRFGVTAPLDDGRWEMPYIVEQNFGIADGLEHALWLQGDRAFDLTEGGAARTSIRDGDGQSLSAMLKRESLMTAGIALHVGSLPVEPATVWCEDRFAKPEERILVREPVTVNRPAAAKLVVVIDGSLSLAGAKDWITRSIGSQDGGKLTLILADDQPRRVTLEELEGNSFTGGRDNEPALREGIVLSRESGCPLVWIHGPQAVRLSQPEALLQLLERGTVHPVIHDVDAVPGPNRLAEEIYRTGCLHRGPSLANPEKDLSEFLQGLLTERRALSWNWKRAATPDGLGGSKVWDQLARFWASTAAENSLANMTDAARSELAARYQLVTPVSGAVVLETQQQYVDHGLTPADGDATPGIPNVPEPSTSLLVVLATAAAMLRRKRDA